MHNPAAPRRYRRVVGDQQQGRLALRAQGEQCLDDVRAGLAVEIAGRLVGEQKPGTGGEGPRNRYALLFAAGKLRGIVVQPVIEPDRREALPGPRERVAGTREFQRDRHVLECAHGRDQVEGLEHDADIVEAETRERVLVQRGQVLARDRDRSGRQALEPGDDHHHGRLARAGGTDDADGFARADGQIDSAQDVDVAARTRQMKFGSVERDHRSRIAAMPGGGARVGQFIHAGSPLTDDIRPAFYIWLSCPDHQ